MSKSFFVVGIACFINFYWHSLEAIMSRFMDVTTDFGFKKLFGDESTTRSTKYINFLLLHTERSFP